MGLQKSTALRIAAMYLAAGLLWIWISDGTLAWYGGLSWLGFWAATGKGTAFVLVSSGLVFWLSYREFRSVAAANALLQAVTDGTNDAMFIKDRAGKYLLLNDAAARIVGQPTSTLLGSDDTALFDSETAQQIMNRDRGVMTRGGLETIEEVIPSSDGTERTFHSTKAPFRDERGKIIGIIGVARDITEKSRAERELRSERNRFEKIVEAVPVVICSFELRPDGSTCMPYASMRIEDFYGLSPADLALDASPIFRCMHADDVGHVRDSIEASAKNMTEWQCEFRVNSPRLGEIWIEGRSRPVRQVDGAIVWHGYIADVTERRRAADLIRTTKDRLREAQRIARLGSWAWEPATEHVWWSDPLYVLFGVTKQFTPSFQAFLNLVHPDDRALCQKRVESLFQGADSFANEIRIIRPDGQERWLHSEARVTRGADHSIVRVDGFDQDITDRKVIEKALQDSEERLRLFIEHAPAALAMFDRDLRIIAVSRRWAADFGLDRNELVNKTLYDVFPEMPAEWREVHRRVLAGEVIHTEKERFARTDGSPMWLRWEARPWNDARGTIAGIALFTEDVTQKQLAEESLRESEERFRKLTELLPDAVFIVANEKIVYCNPAFLHLMGAKESGELLGKAKWEIVAAEFRPAVRARLSAMHATHRPAPLMRQRIIRLDGREVPVYVMSVPMVDRAEEKFLVVMHDLTDRERSDELLRSVMDSVGDTIITISASGDILSANAIAARAFGYEATELLGQNVSLLLSKRCLSEGDHPLESYVHSEVLENFGVVREAEGVRKDGTRFPIELSVTEFSLNGERLFTGVIRDITDRRRLEEQFHQSQKMEAVGQLAGGVAHDFNNLLTIINGYSEMLLNSKIEDRWARELLEEIHKAGERSAGLTQQLLAFSRKQVLSPKMLDVNDVVRTTEKMLRRVIGEDVKLITNLPKVDRVLADPSQLNQVLLNLAVNARDAMPQGGELIIETSNAELDENYSQMHAGVRPGKYVRLCMSDSGHGMTAEVRQHLFEPFYTTKELGKGTGLGLAVVHGIVKQSDGHIQVYSEPGSGTSFKIYLPAITESVAEVAIPDTRSAALKGAETILLVEDEEMVRKLAERSLTQYGYVVLAAANPAEAIAINAGHQGTIDLLLTDVVMPQINGRRLAELLLPERPEMKVLYMSGYTDDAMMRQGVLEAGVQLLNKPFVPSTLGKRVREMLDA